MTAVFVVALLLLLLAAWVRAAGSAVTRVPRADALRDASENVAGAQAVADLLDDRELITPAVGVVASALLVGGSVLATVVLVLDQTAGSALILAVAVGVISFIVGDLVPRQLGRLKPHQLAYRSSLVLTAAVAFGGWANDLLPEPEEAEAEEHGDEAAEEQERELIDSVLEFSETIVREVMTPRPDMRTVPVTASVEELIELATEEGFSRIPVTSNGDVVGLVIVKDLLPRLTDELRPKSVAEVMRPVEFVPETKPAATLLAEMQESHTHQLIVVDEYGDVAGLVTIEDLLEELVGEIADETDLERTLITAQDDGWVVDARLPIDDLKKVTGIDLPDSVWDTVGGLVLGLAQRVPSEGEEFTLDDLVLRVTKMQGRRVSQVSVTPKTSAEAV